MKIIIAEHYNHYKVLENTYHLLKKHCYITFYVNSDKERNKEALFPSARKTKLIENKFHRSTFFIWLLFIGWRYNYINISTGPEHDYFIDILNVIFFYICCAVYRNKIILTVKNSRAYLDTTPGIYSFIRSSAIKYIKRFTFETKTLRKVFSEHNKSNISLLGVSYDRYTDLRKKKIIEQEVIAQKKEVNIGLLGILTDFRRDYNLIINALVELSATERKKIKFIILGATPGGSDNPIIKEFIKHTEVDYISGWITAEQFDQRGNACDILISTLQRKFEYGIYKGTGSFGDAIYLKKKIILPDYVDPDFEFKKISVYYSNKEELVNIFKNIEQYITEKIPSEMEDNYTTESVFNCLMKDLEIPCNGDKRT